MKKLISLAIVLFFAATAFAEETLSLKWNESSGNVDQKVIAGKSITPIVFDYEGITSYSVSGLPSGLIKNIDEKRHRIMIVGTVNSDVMSGDYEYKVTVKNDQGDEKSMSGTIVVKSDKARTSIKLVSVKARQEVLAGNEIEPVVFEFANVRVDESLSSFKFEGSLEGAFEYSVDGNKLTCSGTVDEYLEGGLYTIRIIAIGENNNDTALANVDVIHKSRETKVTVVQNESQSLTAGDPIKPIVFKIKNDSILELTNFPGSYGLKKDGNTVTITGVVEENAKGLYEVVLTVIGFDNNASAKATIDVVIESSSSSVVASSSSEVASSSSAEVQSSSSSAQSSSSVESSSSNNKEESSSSEATTKVATVATSGVKFGYANNVLTVAMPTPSMVRVQVFDMMGHLVESFAETEVSSKSISLAHLTKGNYVVRIESARTARTARILVK